MGGDFPHSQVEARAKAILAHYFFTPKASIVIENEDRFLTEECARAMESLIRSGLIFREFAPEKGDNAVRYGLTPKGTAMIRQAGNIPDIFGNFDLTEPADRLSGKDTPSGEG